MNRCDEGGLHFIIISFTIDKSYPIYNIYYIYIYYILYIHIKANPSNIEKQRPLLETSKHPIKSLNTLFKSKIVTLIHTHTHKHTGILLTLRESAI